MDEIVLIAPYDQMHRLTKQIILHKGYDNVGVVHGDLKDGVQAAYQAIENGANVLISRGGTFTLVRDAVDVPVVEIRTSVYDVIGNIRNIIGHNEPITIVGYDNIVYGYDLLKDFLTNVTNVNIKQGESVEKKLRQCVENGTTIFVGDAVVNNLCKKLGYTCYMLESGEDALVSAIEEARRILSASQTEMERAKRYRALIDYVHDGVVATDDQNRILIFNSVAQEILGDRKEDMIGKSIHALTSLGSIAEEIAQGKALFDEVRELGEMHITLSNVPIVVNNENKGAIAVFQDISKLQNLEKKVRAKLLQKGFVAKYTFDSIIHKSVEIQRCITMAKKFSRYDSSVLIEGNSGVGKELFAQSIHNESRRRSGPFVAINCAALPSSLIESELFGYVEGAFTGSKRGGKAGVFELAHTGTIFLDEISELPIDVQGRLLRVIQEREVMRLGDDKVIPLDVRIICATNKDLKEMVGKGTFRRDLLYRVNTLGFLIPPLNCRREDILVLATHFLQRYCRKYSKEISGFSKQAADYMMQHNYEGNIRELQGMVERAVILCENVLIKLEDVREDFGAEALPQPQEAQLFDTWTDDLPTLQEMEVRYIQKVYDLQKQSTAKTCAILKIDRSTLWRKIKRGGGLATEAGAPAGL